MEGSTIAPDALSDMARVPEFLSPRIAFPDSTEYVQVIPSMVSVSPYDTKTDAKTDRTIINRTKDCISLFSFLFPREFAIEFGKCSGYPFSLCFLSGIHEIIIRTANAGARSTPFGRIQPVVSPESVNLVQDKNKCLRIHGRLSFCKFSRDR